MPWTSEMKEKLKTMCYAGESNAVMAEKLGVHLTEIHAKRSAMGITRAKCQAAVGEPKDRTAAVIKAEIEKVEKAKVEAAKKIGRSVERLAELNLELKEAQKYESFKKRTR